MFFLFSDSLVTPPYVSFDLSTLQSKRINLREKNLAALFDLDIDR